MQQLDPRVAAFSGHSGYWVQLQPADQRAALDRLGGYSAGLPSRQLLRMRLAGQSVSHLAANAWLYPNVPGKRDELASLPPFLLELLPGIAVYPAKEGQPFYPRLPLLGLGVESGLQIAIDCRRSRAHHSHASTILCATVNAPGNPTADASLPRVSCPRRPGEVW